MDNQESTSDSNLIRIPSALIDITEDNFDPVKLFQPNTAPENTHISEAEAANKSKEQATSITSSRSNAPPKIEQTNAAVSKQMIDFPIKIRSDYAIYEASNDVNFFNKRQNQIEKDKLQYRFGRKKSKKQIPVSNFDSKSNSSFQSLNETLILASPKTKELSLLIDLPVEESAVNDQDKQQDNDQAVDNLETNVVIKSSHATSNKPENPETLLTRRYDSLFPLMTCRKYVSKNPKEVIVSNSINKIPHMQPPPPIFIQDKWINHTMLPQLSKVKTSYNGVSFRTTRAMNTTARDSGVNNSLGSIQSSRQYDELKQKHSRKAPMTISQQVSSLSLSSENGMFPSDKLNAKINELSKQFPSVYVIRREKQGFADLDSYLSDSNIKYEFI